METSEKLINVGPRFIPDYTVPIYFKLSSQICNQKNSKLHIISLKLFSVSSYFKRNIFHQILFVFFKIKGHVLSQSFVLTTFLHV
jgi:hypothetical protein